MLIDTHCHLDAAEFDTDRDAVIKRAQAAGVQTIIVPAITMATFPSTLAMRQRYGCPIALGLHPVYSSQHMDAHLTDLVTYVTREKPIAIGEIGLDFFIPNYDAERQIALFNAQLKIARDFDLPVLLHVRKSQDMVMKLLRQWNIRRGIAHAFNGSPQQADAYLKQGFKLGFGGALTFARALNLRRLATTLPLEGIVLETDSPDIPPAWASYDAPDVKPRNEPYHLPRIAALLAELRGLSPQAVAEATSLNAREILDLKKPV